MKIRMIHAVAKIKGRVRDVRFELAPEGEGGSVIIGDVQENELAGIVALLEGGKAAAGELVADPAMTSALAASSPAKPPKAPKVKPAGSQASQPEAPAESAPAPEEKPAEAPSAPASEAKPKTNGASVAVPSELEGARKLRDILAFFMAKGITEKSKLVEECEKVRAGVPILSRITNLEERIGRTLEVMDMGEDNAG